MMSVSTQSILDRRRDQLFPSLEPAEIERARRFGTVRSYRTGEALAKVGEVSPGLVIFLAGHVDATRRDQSGRRAPILSYGPAAFMAELAQLSAPPPLMDASAQGPVETL